MQIQLLRPSCSDVVACGLLCSLWALMGIIKLFFDADFSIYSRSWPHNGVLCVDPRWSGTMSKVIVSWVRNQHRSDSSCMKLQRNFSLESYIGFWSVAASQNETSSLLLRFTPYSQWEDSFLCVSQLSCCGTELKRRDAILNHSQCLLMVPWWPKEPITTIDLHRPKAVVYNLTIMWESHFDAKICKSLWNKSPAPGTVSPCLWLVAVIDVTDKQELPTNTQYITILLSSYLFDLLSYDGIKMFQIKYW